MVAVDITNVAEVRPATKWVKCKNEWNYYQSLCQINDWQTLLVYLLCGKKISIKPSAITQADKQ